MKEFENIASQGKALIDFYADWCGPCRKLTPILEKWSTEFPQVIFYSLNVGNEKLQDIVENYEVTGLPTILLFRDGKEIGRVVGMDEKSIRKELAKL